MLERLSIYKNMRAGWQGKYTVQRYLANHHFMISWSLMVLPTCCIEPFLFNLHCFFSTWRIGGDTGIVAQVSATLKMLCQHHGWSSIITVPRAGSLTSVLLVLYNQLQSLAVFSSCPCAGPLLENLQGHYHNLLLQHSSLPIDLHRINVHPSLNPLSSDLQQYR